MTAADAREELEAVLWQLASRRSTVGQAIAAAERYADARVAGVVAAVTETSKGYQPPRTPRCGQPLSGANRNDDYCARPAGHPGWHMGARAIDRRRWPRPARGRASA